MVAIFALLVYAIYSFPIADKVEWLVDWAKLHPLAGSLVYILSVIIATVLFVPGSGSMLIAGYLFGFGLGTLIAAIAMTLGAQCAFLAGRRVARSWVESKVAGNRRLTAIEAGLREEAFLIVVLTRLSLVIPFNVLNYAYGITSVRSGVHLVATGVGMLAPVALYVYLGTLARSIGEILAGTATPSTMGYWLAGFGVIAIVVLTWVMHRMATRALERHLPPLEEENA